MNENLGSDLKVDDDFDLIIEDGDFAVVCGLPCLIQDLRSALSTYPGEMLDFPFEGNLIPREDAASAEGYDRIISKYESIISEDPRIKKGSVEIKAYSTPSGKLKLAASFKTIDGQSVENFVL